MTPLASDWFAIKLFLGAYISATPPEYKYRSQSPFKKTDHNTTQAQNKENRPTQHNTITITHNNNKTQQKT